VAHQFHDDPLRDAGQGEHGCERLPQGMEVRELSLAVHVGNLCRSQVLTKDVHARHDALEHERRFGCACCLIPTQSIHQIAVQGEHGLFVILGDRRADIHEGAHRFQVQIAPFQFEELATTQAGERRRQVFVQGLGGLLLPIPPCFEGFSCHMAWQLPSAILDQLEHLFP
jgi:hypothetical protein